MKRNENLVQKMADVQESNFQALNKRIVQMDADLRATSLEQQDLRGLRKQV